MATCDDYSNHPQGWYESLGHLMDTDVNVKGLRSAYREGLVLWVIRGRKSSVDRILEYVFK